MINGKIKENDFVMLEHKSGHSYLMKVQLRTFHSSQGSFELKKLIGKAYGCKIKTFSKEEFVVLKPDFKDLIAKALKRKAQIIHPKDIGLIVTYCGIGKETRVLEAGTGSAFLTCYLANIAKEVVSCERREDFYLNAKENLLALKMKNVKLLNIDVIKTKEKGFDVLILDVENPFELIKKLKNKLKIGGRIAVYMPSIDQVIKTEKALKEAKFSYIQIKEVLLREWESSKCFRPTTQMLGHTGFLIFARNLSD